MGGIGAKVHHQLMDLDRVGKDDTRRRRKVTANLDGRWEGCSEEFEHFLDDGAKMQRSGLLLFLATEGEDLLDQVSGSFGGLEDLGKMVSHVVSLRNSHQPHLRIPQDSREDVIEIMSDTPCKRADRFHLLGLAELFLQPLLLRVVNNESPDFTQIAVLIEAPHRILNGADGLPIESSELCRMVGEHFALSEETQKHLALLLRSVKREQILIQGGSN